MDKPLIFLCYNSTQIIMIITKTVEIYLDFRYKRHELIPFIKLFGHSCHPRWMDKPLRIFRLCFLLYLFVNFHIDITISGSNISSLRRYWLFSNRRTTSAMWRRSDTSSGRWRRSSLISWWPRTTREWSISWRNWSLPWTWSISRTRSTRKLGSHRYLVSCSRI